MAFAVFAPLLATLLAFAQVAVPRVEGVAVVVDGRLDEEVWSRAAVLRDFSQYLPNDDRPADD